ncbi:MAG TPA: FkbM family methyltransferase [Polyangiaceae bacterium]|nr:FkbM family methyltransferase [Polyangiaceae bacterium]
MFGSSYIQRSVETSRLARSAARIFSEKLAESASLTRSGPRRLWNVGMLLSVEVQRRLLAKSALNHPLLMDMNGSSLSIFVGGGSDEEVFREVFVDDEYGLVDVTPQVIFDVGANVGYSALYFARKYPQARIFSFEPDPRNFRILQRNTASLSRITCFPMALASHDGEASFYVNRAQGMSSSLVNRAGFDRICVATKTLASVMRQTGVDFVDLLKFDIEGGELALFRKQTELDRVGALIGEVHEDLMGCSLEQFLPLLSGFELNVRRLSACRALVSGKRANGAGARLGAHDHRSFEPAGLRTTRVA